MNYTIRFATEDDLGMMYTISRATHSLENYGELIPVSEHSRFDRHYRWSKKRRDKYIAKMLPFVTNTNATVIIAEKGKRIVGYAVVVRETASQQTIKGLFVHPREQGRGVGKQLFREVCGHSKSGEAMSLEVLETNKKAIHLYESEGFRVNKRLDKLFFGTHLLSMTR